MAFHDRFWTYNYLSDLAGRNHKSSRFDWLMCYSKCWNNVRVMPGRKNSQFENSQSPYVVRYKNGSIVDKNGNKINNNSGRNQNRASEGHVPLDDFDIKN